MELLSKLLCLLVVFSLFTSGISKKFLVIGGNDVLGSELVVQLLRQEDNDVSVLDFYSWNWDESKHRKQDSVTHIKCDRFMIRTCMDFIDLLSNKNFFDMVYDTSTLQPYYLQDILVMVRHRVGRYVFISTAAVYVFRRSSSHQNPASREEDVAQTDQNDLQRQDDYDHNGDLKLQSEEVLENEHKDYQLTYISLRLPDIIGPRDSTDRFWIYFLWVKFQDVLDRPINFPPRLHNQQLSMVFSEDAALQMLVLEDLSSDVFNQAYNLAFKETVTLKEFLMILGKHIGNTNLIFDETDVDGSVYFPSVSRGPVNVTKAEKMLKWKPLTLSEGVKKTAEFYNGAIDGHEFMQQLDRIIDSFVPDSKKEAFRKRCAELYGTKAEIQRTEL